MHPEEAPFNQLCDDPALKSLERLMTCFKAALPEPQPPQAVKVKGSFRYYVTSSADKHVSGWLCVCVGGDVDSRVV